VVISAFHYHGAFLKNQRIVAMRKLLFQFIGLILVAVVAIIGWQIASWELAKLELQEDLVDLASQAGTRIGMTEPSTPEEVRGAIVDDAHKYGIQLDPAQVTVARTGTLAPPWLHIAAAYEAPVKLPGFWFMLHFTITSAK
jgi:hypothetical protein